MTPAEPEVVDLSAVGSPIDLTQLPGLGVAPPPVLLPEVIADIRGAVERAGLKPNQFALVGQLSKKGGWHGGIVGTIPGDIQIHVWVGQHWQRDIDWGVNVMKVVTIGGQ